MRKGLTAKQEKDLNELKKTYSNYKLLELIDFARLRSPEVFPYEHKSRLYKQVTNVILQYMNDFVLTFDKLPKSYREKILLDTQFTSFIDQFTIWGKDMKKKQSDSEEQYTFLLYSKFFNIGVQGLINSMPIQFQPYLKNEIKPFLMLMQSIANFSLMMNPKLKYPSLSPPSFLFTDRETSSMSY